MAQRTNRNEETTKSDEQYPLQFEPSDLHILLRSRKNNGKIVSLNGLDNKSSKQHNQAVQHRKSSQEETCKQSAVDLQLIHHST